MTPCRHPYPAVLVEQIREAGYADHCSWPAYAGLACSRPVVSVINYFGVGPDEAGISGVVMAPACGVHENPIRNWSSERVLVGDVHGFLLDELPEQLAAFQAGPTPMCQSQPMHWITA